MKVLNKEFNLVKKDDGGKNLDSYKYELVKENKTSGEGAGVEESKEESKSEESKSEESKSEESKSEESNGLEYIRKAYRKTNGKVYKIIQAFINADYVALSTEQLRQACDGKFVTHAFDKWDLGSHKYYKIIEKSSNGKYNLRAEIIETLGLM